jgi:hypothetical protein
MPADTLHHERTLLGALDSYLAALVRVRPHLAGPYREALERVAETWLKRNGANAIDAIPRLWLRRVVFESGDGVMQAAADDFIAWAEREGLVEREPAPASPSGPIA